MARFAGSVAIAGTLEIATDDAFTKKVVTRAFTQSPGSQTVIALDVLPPSDYYWHVRSLNDAATGAFSPTFRFRVIGPCSTTLTGTPAIRSDADFGPPGQICVGGVVSFLNDMRSSRPVTLTAGSHFCPDGSHVTWQGPIDGPGSLTIASGVCEVPFVPLLSTDKGTLTLSGNNTFTGGIALFFEGILVVSADENLGAPGAMFSTTEVPTLRFAGSFSSARPMKLDGGLTIDTNGNDVTWTGNILQRQPDNSTSSAVSGNKVKAR